MEIAIRDDNNAVFSKDFSAVQEILNDSVSVGDSQSLDTIKPLYKLNNVNELTENLILCSAASINPKLLDIYGITCIVNVAPELPDVPLQNFNISYNKVPIFDSPDANIQLYFDQISDLIQKITNFGGKTIVYCVAGVSRSASLCIAYLMKHQNLSLLEAYNYVKQKRPRIKPNCSFFRQLIEYEKNLLGYNTVKMLYNDVLQMEIPDVYDNDYKLCNYHHKRSVERNSRH